MRFVSHLRRNLRGSIFTAFSVLLLFSFALVGGFFNVAVRQYIRYGAMAELADARALYDYMGYFTAAARSGLFGGGVNHYYVNERYDSLYEYPTPASREIAEALRQHEIPPDRVNNRRLRTEGGIFYVTVMPAHQGGYGMYAVFYVNVTDISRFTDRINMLLLFLVGFIWALAMIITTLLSTSLSRPLRVLSRFARRIGQGDFTPNPDLLANEEFEALNQSLNQTAKQLAKYDNDQKTFFQNVSHELRTPLMSIKSYAEGIKYGIMDPKTASETILEATNRLTDMVGDILYVSRIDNITLPKEDEVDLCALIAERIRGHEPLAKGITIRFRADDEPVIIPCVTAYIERALDNLISNALRYAKNTVTIECHAIGPRAVILVMDDGPGFEPELLPHVFERFYKGKTGLTGIGLAIVKSIVEQHNGTAMAENREKGAVLTISIPRIKKGGPA